MSPEKKKPEEDKEQRDEIVDPFQQATTIRIELTPHDIARLTPKKSSSSPPTQRLRRASRSASLPKAHLSGEPASGDLEDDDGNPFDQTTTMRIDLSPASDSAITRAATPHRPAVPAAPENIGGRDFQQLLENIYDGCLITDLNGRILDSNARAMHYFRYKRNEFCDRNIVDMISGADRSLLATIRDTLENDQFVLLQAVCIRCNGSTFPTEISVNSIHLADEVYLNFFVRDITVRRETEERLKTGYNAIQNSGNGIAVMDLNADLVECNPSALALLGFEKLADVRGVNLAELLVDGRQALAIVETVRGGVDTWRGELEMIKQGGTFFAQVSAAPNLNFDGDLTGMVLSFLDITERKRSQEQLEKYARELRARNEQLASDQEMARDIQQAFLPGEYPVFPRTAAPEDSALKFSHLYIPSSAVGGDFLDFLAVSNTHAGIFISDVVGHGMRAALVTATLRGLIEQLAPVAHDPGEFMTQLNQAYMAIFGHQPGEILFATAVYLVVDTITGRMRYSNAGHPLPLLLRRSQNKVETLTFSDDAMGPGIGLFGDAEYRSDEYELAVDDVVLLYTDGLVEAASADGTCYEIERFEEALEKRISLPPSQILKEVVEEVQDFSGSKEFQDDVCVLSMEVTRLGQNT